jgi:succinylglutamate desuccinylase
MAFSAVEKHCRLIENLLNRYFKQRPNNLKECSKAPLKLLLTVRIPELFQHLFME